MARRHWLAGGGLPAALALAASLALARPAAAQTVAAWRPFVAEASQRFGVPIAWVERVMQAESGGKTLLGGRPIVSRAGAMGQMQLMPDTWAELRAALALGSDPFNPRDNILAGTAYLRRMYDRFGYPGLFAAYNAGPGRYAAFLAGRRSLPMETIAYLASVTGDRTIVLDRVVEQKRSSLFIVPSNLTGTDAASKHAVPAGLFAIISRQEHAAIVHEQLPKPALFVGTQQKR